MEIMAQIQVHLQVRGGFNQMKQAEWNDITWGHTGRQMAHIKSFRLSQKIKTEEKESVKGGNKTVVRSLEPETLTVSYSKLLKFNAVTFLIIAEFKSSKLKIIYPSL